MNLSKASMRRPITTLMVFISVVVVGAISTRLIPMELFPEFDAPFLVVQIPYPGSTPNEIERQILRPAEEVLSTISGIKRLYADAGENSAQLSIEFNWGEETKIKAIEVRERLESVRDQFPDDVQDFVVMQFSTADMPILQLRVSSERDLSGAYELLDRKIKRPIERLDGVSKVDLYGVNRKEVRIELIADRVAAHRIDLNRLVDQLSNANFSVTAGRITDGNKRFNVRPVGELKTTEEIENLIINAQGLRLSDIADVRFDDPELDYGRHLDRAYAVGLDISKEAGANTVEVTSRINEQLDEINNDPDMRGITIFAMNDAAAGIVSSLSDLLESGMLGGLFALLVLFFFLRRISTTLIVVLAVPISILVTVGVMYFLGLSLNMLSMMGLMLAVGMLVDNAVVVTESIHRHQHLTPEDRWGATLRGVKEVAMAVTAGTLTTAIVFLPMIVSNADQVTLFLKHVSIAITVALFTSLLISLTVVPLLSVRFKPPSVTESQNVVARFTERYARLLDWLLHHRRVSVSIVIGLLISVAIPGALVRQDFFPEENGDRVLYLYYNINGSYTVERVEQAVDKVEDFLFDNKEAFEIESVYTYYQGGFAQSTIMLEERGESSIDELQNLIRDRLPQLTIAKPTFTRDTGGGDDAIRVTLRGESSEVLMGLSYDVEEVLSHVAGFEDVRSEAEMGEQEVRVIVDRDRARQYGFSTQQVAGTISAALRGQNLRRFRTDQGEVNMRLLLQDADRRNLDQLRNLPIQQADGGNVKLAAMAEFQIQRGPRNIHREDRITMIGVTASLVDMTVEEAREKINEVMENYEMPTGYSWGYGARFQRDADSQNIMMMNLLLALALIYLVMASLFESLVHPAAIWTSIVFAIVGVFWFFLITDTTFSIMAWIGILVLIGVVVNNGIVLIDHINHLRDEGMDRHEAIVRAGRERMRPIIMTAATTVLGLIPLCIGTTQIGGDGPPYFPMARAIVGGLTFSTVVTLIVLPTVYILLDDLRSWGYRMKAVAAPKN